MHAQPFDRGGRVVRALTDGIHYSVVRFGRRIPYCAFMLIGGVAGMLALAVPDKPGE